MVATIGARRTIESAQRTDLRQTVRHFHEIAVAERRRSMRSAHELSYERNRKWTAPKAEKHRGIEQTGDSSLRNASGIVSLSAGSASVPFVGGWLRPDGL